MIDWFALCITDMLAATMVLAGTDCDNGPGRQASIDSEDSLLSGLLLAVCAFFKCFRMMANSLATEVSFEIVKMKIFRK